MGGGPIDFKYISAEDYHEKAQSDKRPLSELQRLAAEPKRKCCVCETMPVWRLGGCGMCFSCTTGEADASDDYELIYTGGDTDDEE